MQAVKPAANAFADYAGYMAELNETPQLHLHLLPRGLVPLPGWAGLLP